jgi:hypothetical protein
MTEFGSLYYYKWQWFVWFGSNTLDLDAGGRWYLYISKIRQVWKSMKTLGVNGVAREVCLALQLKEDISGESEAIA